MAEPKKWKIEFTPGALEDFDQLPEADAQELMEALKKACEDGSLVKNAEKVDMARLKREDPALYERLTGKKVGGN